MTPETSAALQAIGTMLAVGVAVWAILSAKRSQRTADRALEMSARAQREGADALVGVRQELALANAPKSVVWSIGWERGDSYSLTNMGGQTALDVTIDIGRRSNNNRGKDLTHEAVGPREAVWFDAGWHAGVIAPDVCVVRWTNSAGEEREFRLPFPRGAS